MHLVPYLLHCHRFKWWSYFFFLPPAFLGGLFLPPTAAGFTTFSGLDCLPTATWVSSCSILALIVTSSPLSKIDQIMKHSKLKGQRPVHANSDFCLSNLHGFGIVSTSRDKMQVKLFPNLRLCSKENWTKRQGSKTVKSRVPGIWFVWKIWDFSNHPREKS